MAKGYQVLEMLCPEQEWTISGDDYDSIIWKDNKVLLSKEEFNSGFAKVDAAKIKAEAEASEAKAKAEAKLAALGLTENDLKALGLG